MNIEHEQRLVIHELGCLEYEAATAADEAQHAENDIAKADCLRAVSQRAKELANRIEKGLHIDMETVQAVDRFITKALGRLT